MLSLAQADPELLNPSRAVPLCPLGSFSPVFFTAEKLTKLADGDKATTEDLLVLLEEGVWTSVGQQGFSRFVSCSLGLF